MQKVCDVCGQYREMYTQDNLNYCVCISCKLENESRLLTPIKLKKGDFAYNPKTKEHYFILDLKDGWLTCRIINLKCSLILDYYIHEDMELIKLDLGEYIKKKKKTWYGFLTKFPTVPTSLAGRRIVLEQKEDGYTLEIENVDGSFNIFSSLEIDKIKEILQYFEDKGGYDVAFAEPEAYEVLYGNQEI